MVLKSWFLLYSASKKGRIAAFSGLVAVLVVMLHFFSGPPPLARLTVLDAKVEQLGIENNMKSSYAVRLTLRGEDRTVTQAQYFVNKGDAAGESLQQLNGQSVRVWFEPDYLNTIYQLETGGRRVIDYDTRRAQLTGSPVAVSLYFAMAVAVFMVLTVGLLRERRAASA